MLYSIYSRVKFIYTKYLVSDATEIARIQPREAAFLSPGLYRALNRYYGVIITFITNAKCPENVRR